MRASSGRIGLLCRALARRLVATVAAGIRARNADGRNEIRKIWRRRKRRERASLLTREVHVSPAVVSAAARTGRGHGQNSA